MAFEAGADGALLLLRGSGDRLLLGRRDEALVAVGARDEDLAAVGADTARAGIIRRCVPSGDRWWRPGASSTSTLWGH